MRNDYKKRILECLNQSPAPIDVEKIRKSCKIANWNTALKHCLELVFGGNIKGQTTSEGWVFWTHQETHLEPWEEVVGTLDRIENSETQTIALLTCTYKKQIAISLPRDQPETQKLDKLLGQKIRILKTDIPEKPVAIKSFNETTATQKLSSPKLWIRRRVLIVLRNSVFSEGGC